MNNIKYRIYPTLLDSYQNYLSSSEIYQKFWGFSDEPELTEEEFEQKQFQSLIDRINRVPFDSEVADQGTVFNEIIDCMILKCKSEKMEIENVYETNESFAERECNSNGYHSPDAKKRVEFIKAIYNGREFQFPISLCLEFANYYKGAIPQARTESILSTRYGDVQLYGYIDELMPTAVHDIKTTKSYTAGDFKKHWQHIVYPYCLNANGNHVTDFEYNIAEINRTKYGVNYKTFTEYFCYNPETDIQRLTKHVEGLIEFLESNKHLITDKKIFNKQD